ncbi:MAG TPA: Holliday junction resolvase RuvX [bacterium]
MTRLLGIDVGTRRIGVALSDPTGTIAQSLTVLPRRSWEQILGAIAALIREHHVAAIIVGLPVRLDGGEGEAAAGVRKFAERLRATAEVPVMLEDERLSTAEAERVMIEADVRRAARRARRDAVAAALILQRYLDRGRAPRGNGEETSGGDAG